MDKWAWNAVEWGKQEDTEWDGWRRRGSDGDEKVQHPRVLFLLGFLVLYATANF